MNIIKALACLQILTNELLTFADLGKALGVTRGAISNRISRNKDVLTNEEIKTIDNYFDVSLESVIIAESIDEFYTLKERPFPVEFSFKNAGRYMQKTRIENDLTIDKFAKKLNIDDERMTKILGEEVEPNIKEIFKFASHFDVDLNKILIQK